MRRLGMLVGVLLLIALGGVLYSFLQAPGERLAEWLADDPSRAGDTGAATPKYDFYGERSEPEGPAGDSQPGGFMVQAGAFRSFDEADRMKATLALLGMRADIDRETTADGAALHRVRIGPIAGAAEVRRLRQRLAEEGIDSFAVPLSAGEGAP